MTDNVHAIENMDELNKALRELKTVIKAYEDTRPITDEVAEKLLNLPDEWDSKTVTDNWETAINIAATLLAGCHIGLSTLGHLMGIGVITGVIQLQDMREKAECFGCLLADAVQKLEEQEQDND